MLRSIAVVWLPVTDMERSIAFYRDALGLEVTERDGGWSAVQAGGQLIGLNAGESPAGNGGAVIAFASHDIEADVVALRDRGVRFTGEVSDHPWGKIAPFQDPDGNDLQVYQAA